MTPHPSRTRVFLCAALVMSHAPRALAPGGTPRPPSFRHVFVLVEENKNYASVIDNTAPPYPNRLADQYRLATQYHPSTHTSTATYLQPTVSKTLTKERQ